ncbi:MAG: EAL domain-containing protein [Campylobacterota bacterium]|nr:EAL domain-containing protein [Campylobacterota bacterium]
MDEKSKRLRKEAKKFNVLYVEGEKQVRESLKNFLSTFFNSVVTANCGMDGLDIYKQCVKDDKIFNIVITDLNTTKLDGSKLCEEILKINNNQMIVVISSNAYSEHFIKLINLGINYFIQKPIDNENVTNVLYKAVRSIKNEYEIIQKHERLSEQNENLELEVQHQTLALYQRLYYDELTKLPKRNRLIEDIDKLDPCGLLIINIDDFKNINSVYGHDLGDKVLVEFTEALLNIALERGCGVYNIGGDEFVFLNINNKVEGYCQDTAKLILDTIEDSGINIELDSDKINVSLNITIGMAVDEEQLFNKAQMALALAEQKRLPFVVYSKEFNLEKEPTNDIQITKMIKNAIDEDRVVPYFQPIHTSEGKIKYESLIRIEEGEKVISPASFLEISKKIRYYPKLTRIMIEKSFTIFSNREEEFSINLSFEDIINHKTMEFLFEMIEKYNVNNQLIIEILESENIDDFNIVKAFILKVKALGARIAIDDFGSGYSNFSYLLQMHPDFIKIDGSIIKNIDHDEGSNMIAKTIKTLTANFGAKTVAEFIHNEDVYKTVKELGVDAFQGYYFSEPVKLTCELRD